MKLLNTKYLEIGEEKYPLRISCKAYILFEELSGKSIEDMSSVKDMTHLLYAGIKVGCQYEKKSFKMSYDKFLDLVDDYPQVMTQISLFEIIEDATDSSKKK